MPDRLAPRLRARPLAFLSRRLALLTTLFVVALAAGAAEGPPTVDLDTADAATLAAALPGIGPVKAGRIVAHRERHGPFGTPEALLAVKGIGPATLARILPYLRGGGGDASDTAPPPALPPSSPAAPPATDATPVPRSTSELERATRSAVGDIVAGAERDARRATGR